MPNNPQGLPSDRQKKNSNIGSVKNREIVEEMKDSYIDYAMSVIVARALPDVRDGLKPVHRRILYAMYDMGLSHSSKFRKSATVVGECFVKDTMILTTNGILPIQKIRIGDSVYTQNSVRKVTQIYEMPAKPLLKITLDSGVFNIATLSQKFKILNPQWEYEWKKAKDLTTQDHLVLKADYPEINDYMELLQIETGQPKYLNENIAYLLGLFTSDGWITEDYGKKKYSRLGFTAGNSKNIAERVVSIFEKEFGYSPTIESKEYLFKNNKGELSKNERHDVRINRKTINDFFVLNFSLNGKKAINKEIPYQIFSSPRNVLFSFISGLIEGDGFISSNKNKIHYGSISKKLIDQLQILLLSQEIFSSKYIDGNLSKSHFVGERIVKKRYNYHFLEIYGANAVKLASRINLADKEKNNRVRILSYKNINSHHRKGLYRYDLIPFAGKNLFQELSDKHLGSGWYQDAEGNKFRMGIKYPDGTKIRYCSKLQEKPLRKTQVLNWGINSKLEKIDSPFFNFLEDVVKNKIYFARVTSIKKMSPEKTYDFEVENDHEFIANGVISHNCLGKYHPHGDVAVYDALTRMAQDFSLRYPLIEGQGNFGSLDGDASAAMRYTECRLSDIGEETLKDIEKETVDFIDNYDGTRKEPVVLPSPLPQLLLNGSLGIAVGMATNIPPHNLSELVDALVHLIDRPKTETSDLFQFIQGPDFPTGGIIYDQKEIISAYSQGKGPIVMRGKADVLERGGNTQIIISEIPYQVQKSDLVMEMANLVSEKKIEGIRDIKDLTDREGMRIVIDVKKGYQPQRILNRLYKFTNLQKIFYLNMLALVDGIQPKILSLSEVLRYFIEHRKEVVTKRTKFDLEKAKERTHILEGLVIALRKIDAVISTIKKSKDREEAKKNLMKKFKLTERQSVAILEMKLQTLAGLERKKIEEELKEVLVKIKELSAILKSPEKLKTLVKKEFQELRGKYGDKRKTKVIKQKLGEITEIDLVPLEETIVTLTRGGYIKRINPATYKIQKRGGKGMLGMKTMGDDIVEHFLSASTHDNMLFFTDSGKVFQTQLYEIPEGTRVARGRGLMNFLEISTEDKVLVLLPIKKEEAGKVKFLVMVTRNGKIKKTALEDFKNVRRSGIIAIKLQKGDALEKVVKTSGEDEIILTTKKGIAIRFKEKDIRAMGRAAAGVKGINLKKGDEVIGMEVIGGLKSEVGTSKASLKNYLLAVMENGYGKRTDISQYRVQGRGGSGVKTAQITAKTGDLIFTKILSGEEEDLIVISQKGQVIRTKIGSISILGRATQGVRIMRLDPGDKVASGACI